MSVKTYSLARDGEALLSANFKVREFRCKGEDEILIDDALVFLLQRIREHFGKPIIISSAYRSKAYNARIGGAKASQHMYGTACDIRIEGVAPRAIAEYAESQGAGGIGLYEYGSGAGKTGFVHVDVRPIRARWWQTSPNGGAQNVNGFYGAPVQTGNPKLWKGCKGDDVIRLQQRLTAVGYPAKADGNFGAQTEEAVKAFQTKKLLVPDGVVGLKTWTALGVSA